MTSYRMKMLQVPFTESAYDSYQAEMKEISLLPNEDQELEDALSLEQEM